MADGWFWLRYHPGPVNNKRPWYGMTAAERRAFNARMRPAQWKGHDAEVAALARAVVEGDLGALAPLYDRLAGGEVAGFDPTESRCRLPRQIIRRYWSHVGRLAAATAKAERLRVVLG